MEWDGASHPREWSLCPGWCGAEGLCSYSFSARSCLLCGGSKKSLRKVTSIKKCVLLSSSRKQKGREIEKGQLWSVKVPTFTVKLHRSHFIMCLKFFNTCIICKSWVMKSLLAWLQMGNVCFVWSHLAGVGTIKAVNMKKDSQKCRCLRLSPLFLASERGRGFEWASYKCALLRLKLGNVYRLS